MPFCAIQALNRPDLTAKLAVIELPLYLGIFFLTIKGFGLIGAALAWTLRTLMDAGLLFWCAHRLLPGKKAWNEGLKVNTSLLVLFVGLIVSVAAFSSNLGIKVVFLASFFIIFALITWNYFLDYSEKQKLLALFSLKTFRESV